MRFSFFLLVFFILTLSACSKDISISSPIDSLPELSQSQILISDVLKGEQIVVLSNQNTLYLIDPEYANPVALYQFSSNEAPVNQNFDIFKLSPNKQKVFWYNPKKGLISLDIATLKTQVIEPPSDFFNTYPYFEFSQNEMVNFIVRDGYSLKQLNFLTQEDKFINIPYPYGNVFKISPDNKSVLFVSGYGQNQASPKFMFADLTNSASRQFSAEINVFDRNRVFWAVDSSGIIMINLNRLDLYPLVNPDQIRTIITLPEDINIQSVSNLDNYIFIYDSRGYWRLYDYYTAKEIARTPDGIASELSSPRFIPWTKDSFLIEEKIIDHELEFNRLWLSDFRGNKKIVFNRYNEVLISKTKLDL